MPKKEVTQEDLQETPVEEPAVETPPVETPPKETPSGDLEEEAPVILGGPEEEPPVPKEPSEPKLKYKSHEEAEKAYAEAEKKMHEATKLAADREKELERYKESLKRLGGEEEKPKELTFRQKVMRQAKEAIGKIPDDDPERDDKVLDILAEANEIIAEAKIDERRTKQTESQNAITAAETAAKEAGLSLVVEDNGVKRDLGIEAFWLLAKAPGIPRNATFEEETKWIIDQYNLFKNAIIEDYLTKQKKPKGQPMGRGTKIPVPSEEEERPTTMAEDLKKLKHDRIIQK